MATSSKTEPKSFKEASQSDKWIKAMNAEIEALEANRTWILTDLPPNKFSIGCKWVYKVKYKANGLVERYKARLVAKRYTHIEGQDYLDTFSPVTKITNVRLLLALVVVNNCHLKQLDVNNVFLHGNHNEEVYMNLPPIMHSTKSNQVCILHRSLYGLKQAGRLWYVRLSTFLISHGYRQYSSDHSLFLKQHLQSSTALLIYVDDIVLLGNDLLEIKSITVLLDEVFRIKDFDDLKIFLGFEVAHN